MSPRDVATIGIRIIAVYFGVQSVVQIASLLSYAADAGGTVPGSLWGPPIALGVVAVVLWALAAALGTSAAAGTSDPVAPAASHPIEHLVGVGVFLVGVVFGVQAIMRIIARLIVGEEGSFVPIIPIAPGRNAYYVSLAQLAIAIGLLWWGRAKLAARAGPQP